MRTGSAVGLTCVSVTPASAVISDSNKPPVEQKAQLDKRLWASAGGGMRRGKLAINPKDIQIYPHVEACQPPVLSAC